MFKFIYKFFFNKCPDCKTELIEFRNVHDTCPKCDLIMNIPETITIEQAKDLFSKAIVEGVTFGVNTQYIMMSFEDLLAEVTKK